MKLQIAILCGVLTIGAMGGFAAGLIVGHPSPQESSNGVIRALYAGDGQCIRHNNSNGSWEWMVSARTARSTPIPLGDSTMYGNSLTPVADETPIPFGVNVIGGYGAGCPQAYFDAESDAKQAQADAQARQDRRKR